MFPRELNCSMLPFIYLFFGGQFAFVTSCGVYKKARGLWWFNNEDEVMKLNKTHRIETKSFYILRMGIKERSFLCFSVSYAFVLMSLGSFPLFANSQCNRKPVVFNFGDSNSDTGGFSLGSGFTFGPPTGRAFFHRPTGRLCDGRLLIDFLCKFPLNFTLHWWVFSLKMEIYD